MENSRMDFTHLLATNIIHNTEVVNKYRKRPVIIEAVKWDGSDDIEYLVNWADSEHKKIIDWYGDGTKTLRIETLEGPLRAIPGDWIIKGIKGEFYPCKPDIFMATYQEVEE